jgi:antitoxin component of RelBE/YafQ-DinJ toxin-antitoxin module
MLPQRPIEKTKKVLKEKRLSVRIDSNLLNAFGNLCRESGTSPSEQIRRYMYKCVGNKELF